ncbi:MAG: tyrosine-type recombinase/integrase [Clostridium sp.]|jgi:integrase|nr:tyrosine-type recombinase/integrase [Clostridium sp.]CDC61067.1 site-specific recombinase phage integrase family [Clostridium sp. CAG:417]
MPRVFRNKFGRKTVRPFKKQDLNSMIVICKKNKNAAEEEENKEQVYLWDRNYMILHLGRNLAFRIEDLLQLKTDNFKNGGIYTREFKTGKEQAFELHPSLRKDLEDYINRNKLVEGEYLFKSRKGTNIPITRQRAWQIIKELSDEVKVSYVVGCHSLRKYFAREYYEQTGDLIGLKEMLNHSSETVTLRYICWEEDDKNIKRKNFYLGG